MRESVINRLNKPIITTRYAKRVHVSSSSLSRLASYGVISRVARGVYLNTNATEQIPIHIEDIISSVKSVKDGAICLISALSYYKLTNEIPRENWISIPENFNPRTRKNIRFIKLPDYKLGLKHLRIKGISIKIYNEEITIVDSFKYLSFETAIEALENYFIKKKKNCNRDKLSFYIDRLNYYSKKRNIDISKYIEEMRY